ncbi:MAG TPA: NAD(P)/FAD-dependent oxidoreductase [Candidatus Kapabacteria bacterium]|nr:NAD(P)/FAD-dependent oxidoreductase [Candidatus Kapabacteria bacterium]
MKKHVTILGAGLTGPLLAVYLAKRGFTVDVYERRGDMRLTSVERGRSINLALSTRGIHALEATGIADEVLADAIPMLGRMIHDVEGETGLQPYGTDGQAINSVSRSGLNIELMNAADRCGGISFHFNQRCVGVDLERRVITLADDRTGETREVAVTKLIATDGANSALREAFEERVPGFRADVEWLEHGYKELSIPANPDGSHRMDPNALHIWPRHDFMMIALPNPDGTFTCTIFAPMTGEHSFETIRSDEAVTAYFEQYYRDALPMMPTLLEDWHGNPTSGLATVHCGPWHFNDWALLMGDAAHAIVPFYGQGMNACFEDVFVFDQLMESIDDWGMLIRTFYNRRKPDTDAIADLALANFVEMRSKVVDPRFLQKKRIDAALHDMFPDRWIPLYSMVTFSTIPYSEAAERARQQDLMLDEVGYDVVENAIAMGAERVETILFGEH